MAHCNVVINWIEEWLTHRRQRVIVDGEISRLPAACSKICIPVHSEANGVRPTPSGFAAVFSKHRGDGASCIQGQFQITSFYENVAHIWRYHRQ